jgi:hypothetical protein
LAQSVVLIPSRYARRIGTALLHQTLCEMAPAELPVTSDLVLEIQAEKPFVASRSSAQFVRSAQDFLDLLIWGSEHGTELYLLMDTNFTPEFYDLSTGLAGEILQKVSNYRVRLAIFGSFQMVVSRRFREFMTESNKGSSVCFLSQKAKALTWLLS